MHITTYATICNLFPDHISNTYIIISSESRLYQRYGFYSVADPLKIKWEVNWPHQTNMLDKMPQRGQLS